MQKIPAKISNQIWLIKIVAIFTTFFAHMPVSAKTLSLSESYSWLVRLFSFLGMVGVPTFFIVSGYLFKPGKIIKRAKSLLIPLVIWGGTTYSLHCFNIGFATFSIKGLVLWTLGYNCYLYFVPVLFAIIMLYNMFSNDWIWILTGIISVWLYQMHFISYSGVTLTPYMNPLNFIPYFAFGRIVRTYNLWENFQSTSVWIVSIVVMVIFFVLKEYYVHVWYFELSSFIVNIAFAIFLISITRCFERIPDSIVTLGKSTFVIYLCHMPIATTINKLLSNHLIGPLEPIKVLIAFVIVAGVVYSGYVILSRLHYYKFMAYIGYRK